MTALQSYPAYKDSGVEWLGDVPEHWEVRRLKHWLEINRQVLPEDTDPAYEFDYLDIGSVATGRLTEPPKRLRFGGAPSRARRIVAHGDTIVSTVRTYLKAVWYAKNPEERLIASTGFAVLTPDRNAAPGFVGYACQSDPFVDRVTAESVGIAYPAISETRFATFSVCVPPLPEQTAIARFLDDADRRIRRYIRAKERLIELLEEERRATIHEAVTGRIDVRTGQPYPAYKDSGVEWLGRVPEHWERRRLKTLLRVVDRRSSTGEETLLSLRRDHGVVVYSEHFARPPQGRTLVGYKQLAVGQLVINRLQANNGLVFCSGVDGLVSPDYSVFEKTASVQMKYLSDLLRTSVYRSHFRRVSTGLGTGTAGFLRLYDDVFLSTTVFLPPEGEQVSILEYLGVQTRKIEGLVASSEHSLSLLDEYRTRLIADVVTGKLDVREAAADLPGTDPLVANRDRAESIPTESNLHSTAPVTVMAKEAVS